MRADLPDFEPEAILEVLVRHGVDCVLIGGTAAYVHGSPFVTEDVDITPKVDIDNYARLSQALTELDAKVRAQGIDPLPFNHNAQSLMDATVWNLTTKFGDLDITTSPSGTSGYEDLRIDANHQDVGAVTVLVASLADIVRSKAAAGRDKDRRVLPVLRELLGEQTKARAAERRRPKA